MNPLIRFSLLLGAVSFVAVAVAVDDIVDPYSEYRDEVDTGVFSYDSSEDVPWIENETEVLALPSEQHLVPLELDMLPDQFELFVDRSRITVGEEDRVVRMWLWVRSNQGNETGTFEGFRCATGEYKIYAHANPGREPPVRIAKRARWKPVRPGDIETYRWELLRDYLCSIRGTRSPREIQDYMTGEFKRETFLSE
jgi:hypothetical protein